MGRSGGGPEPGPVVYSPPPRDRRPSEVRHRRPGADVESDQARRPRRDRRAHRRHRLDGGERIERTRGQLPPELRRADPVRGPAGRTHGRHVSRSVDRRRRAPVPDRASGRSPGCGSPVARGGRRCSSRSRTYHIYELVDGGPVVARHGHDPRRPESGPSPTRSGTGPHFYVVSGGPLAVGVGVRPGSALQPGSKDRASSTLDPNFPVTDHAETGVDSMVLAKDSLGTLWTTYIE